MSRAARVAARPVGASCGSSSWGGRWPPDVASALADGCPAVCGCAKHRVRPGEPESHQPRDSAYASSRDATSGFTAGTRLRLRQARLRS